MSDILNAFGAPAAPIIGFDEQLCRIVLLSLRVPLSAGPPPPLIGLPLGAFLGIFRFPGRAFLVVLFNALMGLPPVVAGLLLYLILSRSGPRGSLGLLFPPTAMILAQAVLVLP